MANALAGWGGGGRAAHLVLNNGGLLLRMLTKHKNKTYQNRHVLLYLPISSRPHTHTHTHTKQAHPGLFLSLRRGGWAGAHLPTKGVRTHKEGSRKYLFLRIIN